MMRMIIMGVVVALAAFAIFVEVPQPGAQAGAQAEASRPVAKKIPETVAPAVWPPQLGQPYPDVTLINQHGEVTSLSQFRGRVVIVEPIGMTCPACNAYSGAATHGVFGGGKAGNMPSFEEFFKGEVKDIAYDDPRIVHVSLLLYNMAMQGPTPDDAKAWAEHFKLTDRPEHYVLAGGQAMVNKASYDLIPGFQLVDKQGVLRYDGAGHAPRHDLRTLVHAVPQLVAEPE